MRDSVTFVPGAVIFVIVMVLVVPVGVMFAGAIWSALFGWLGSDDANQRAEGPRSAESGRGD